MAKEQKTNLYLLAIVAIVAVVGIVILVLNSGTISVSDDLTGQATVAKTSTLSTKVPIGRTSEKGVLQEVECCQRDPESGGCIDYC